MSVVSGQVDRARHRTGTGLRRPVSISLAARRCANGSSRIAVPFALSAEKMYNSALAATHLTVTDFYLYHGVEEPLL
jgi:hypothetical protein